MRITGEKYKRLKVVIDTFVPFDESSIGISCPCALASAVGEWKIQMFTRPESNQNCGWINRAGPPVCVVSEEKHAGQTRDCTREMRPRHKP
jgi:hypothetical protein